MQCKENLRIFKFLDQTLTIDSSSAKMGIINLTPDSFSDGGCYQTLEDVLKQADFLLLRGFCMFDIGGESTRPGAKSISIEEEIKRIKAPLLCLKKAFPCIPISLDTRHAAVAKVGLDCGVEIINDVSGGTESMFRLVATYRAGYILMHARTTPDVMQKSEFLKYNNLQDEILTFFKQKIAIALDCGLSPLSIMLDPGIGFSKTSQHNMQIIENIHQYLHAMPNHSWLMGHSRKRFLGDFFPHLTKDDATLLLTEQMKAKQLPLLFRLHQ